MPMVISHLGLTPEALRGETVIVTGAGGGLVSKSAQILLEAALLYMIVSHWRKSTTN